VTEQTLREIWQGPAYQAFRRALQSEKPPRMASSAGVESVGRPCRNSKPASTRRLSADANSASELGATAASRAWENSRPMAAPICYVGIWAAPGNLRRAMGMRDLREEIATARSFNPVSSGYSRRSGNGKAVRARASTSYPIYYDSIAGPCRSSSPWL
jgi:hypothetical protein